MSTRIKHSASRTIALLAAILTYAVDQPVSAQISTVVDPVGDTSIPAPAFQDIVSAQMTMTASGGFELLMELEGSVPGSPILPPPGLNQIWWSWMFDLDPTTSPRGYPASPGVTLIPEFIVYVSWDGTQFAGTAVDRRPLLTGGTAIITPVPFFITGTKVEAVLDFTVIGEVPPIFDWRPTTLDWASPLGAGGYFVVDNAPFTEFPGASIGGGQLDLFAFRLWHGHARNEARISSTSKDQLAWQQCQVRAFESLSGVPDCMRVVPRGAPKTTRNRA
jgi:hypothetical protein